MFFFAFKYLSLKPQIFSYIVYHHCIRSTIWVCSISIVYIPLKFLPFSRPILRFLIIILDILFEGVAHLLYLFCHCRHVILEFFYSRQALRFCSLELLSLNLLIILIKLCIKYGSYTSSCRMCWGSIWFLEIGWSNVARWYLVWVSDFDVSLILSWPYIDILDY